MIKPITVIIDTREQEPYSFPTDRVTPVRRALPAGDYSLEGRETEIAVERKSLADFVSTVIRGRERFRKELVRLESYRRACVVIEGSMSDITRGRYPGGAHPSSVLGALISIVTDYNIQVFFCGDRPHACRFVEDYLRRCSGLKPRPTLASRESEKSDS
jgi:ERCC4-type nuclease